MNISAHARSPRIAITGMGAVCCLGTGVRTFWAALLAGRYGIRPLTRFDTAQHRQKTGGEVEGFTLAKAPDPAVQFAVAAAREAAETARFGAMGDLGVLLAGGGASKGLGAARFIRASEAIAADIGAKGVLSGVSLSCASGSAAIGYAMDLLRAGAADVAVAVGYDAISEWAWSGLTALRTMTTDLIRPFDARRDGTIFSEGAGAMVLETAASAEARGVETPAELLGHGENNNAFHMAHPDSSGEGMVRAMRMALEDAGIHPEAVDHVNAHGTGTQYNDSIETKAIKTVFGQRAHRIPINSIKSMLGHAMGAASALEAIASVMTIRTGTIPPTINLEQRDPECDLDYVPGRVRAQQVNVVLSNSAGIGGPNSVLVLGRWSSE